MNRKRFISGFADDYEPYREKIEWANYWWDEAYSPSSRRILMIEDFSFRFFTVVQ